MNLAGKDDDDGKDNSLLPTHIDRKRKTSGDRKDIAFKCYVIISMTIIWTAYTLLVRYTRSHRVGDMPLYSAPTVVLLAECTKFCISIAFILHSCRFHLRDTRDLLSKEFFGRPWELAKMSVPSIAYALQNNLDFVALSNLDAGVYQVTTQLKVVTTAIFMVLMLSRRYSLRRWLAITLLFAGVAAVQSDAVDSNESAAKSSAFAQNYVVGLAAVLSTCVTAGFAGVYFEKMLKDGGTTPFWIRNLQMYTCGVISAGIGCAIKDGASLVDGGFFRGYDSKVFCIIGLLGVGGIYISLVMKYLDNLHKSFASAFSIILVVVASLFLFENVQIGWFFMIGSATVCFAVLLYNSVNE